MKYEQFNIPLGAIQYAFSKPNSSLMLHRIQYEKTFPAIKGSATICSFKAFNRHLQFAYFINLGKNPNNESNTWSTSFISLPVQFSLCAGGYLKNCILSLYLIVMKHFLYSTLFYPVCIVLRNPNLWLYECKMLSLISICSIIMNLHVYRFRNERIIIIFSKFSFFCQ